MRTVATWFFMWFKTKTHKSEFSTAVYIYEFVRVILSKIYLVIYFSERWKISSIRWEHYLLSFIEPSVIRINYAPTMDLLTQICPNVYFLMRCSFILMRFKSFSVCICPVCVCPGFSSMFWWIQSKYIVYMRSKYNNKETVIDL